MLHFWSLFFWFVITFQCTCPNPHCTFSIMTWLPKIFFFKFLSFFLQNTNNKNLNKKEKTLHFLCIKICIYYMYTICIPYVYCMFTYQVPTQNWACVKKISNGTLQDTVICVLKIVQKVSFVSKDIARIFCFFFSLDLNL